jgi:hypothetical protein
MAVLKMNTAAMMTAPSTTVVIALPRIRYAAECIPLLQS